MTDYCQLCGKAIKFMLDNKRATHEGSETMISTKHGWQRRTQCAVDYPYGRRIQDVMPTATPGVVVHVYPVVDAYSVTHQRSGQGIGWYIENVHEAQDIAEALGPLADWTWPAEELRADDEVRRQLANMGVTR